MKNTAKRGVVHFLILQSGDKYIGICREFGFVEEAATFGEVKDRLFKSAELLIKTVQKNPHLESSLNTSPPLRYLALYYILPLWGSILSFFKKCNGNFQFLTRSISNGEALSQS